MNSPARGLQLQLAAQHGKPVDDTLIVENLGYLQLKATPGVYHLEIRDGRGREVFAVESAGNEGDSVRQSRRLGTKSPS